MDLENITFNQKLISFVSGQTTTAISRYMSENKIPFTTESANSRKRYSFEQVSKVIKDFIADQLQVKEQIQVFYNFKGGTGKTSLCHQVAVHLALMGFKVLAVDCDPQAHLSSTFGFNEYSDDLTVYDALINGVDINSTIKQVYPGLDLVPSNLSMTTVEIPFSQKPNREKLVSKLLSPLKKKYDFILVDTNPTISNLNQSITYSADRLNIVCETQPYSLKGLSMLVREIQDFSKEMEHSINYCIIPNKYESKTVTSQEALGTLRHEYKEAVLNSLVRKCEDINISAQRKLPIHAFVGSKSVALEDIRDLTNELIEKSTVKRELTKKVIK
ncbi:MAG: AAA family ATPase [Flavobacteriales bacterium]|nr:AAA family ATPase [Flavobacteriales bacterium]